MSFDCLISICYGIFFDIDAVFYSEDVICATRREVADDMPVHQFCGSLVINGYIKYRGLNHEADDIVKMCY